MKNEAYTAEAICLSMGLEGFIEPEWVPPALRLLLKPSFHPEVCVTFCSGPAGPKVWVVALTERFWGKPFQCRIPEHREEATLPALALDQGISDFAAAFSGHDIARRVFGLDGMGMECCLATSGKVERFAEQVFRPEVSGLVSAILRSAWQACEAPQVRNALAACAGYVGGKYPTFPEPPVPPVSRLLVLGAPEAKTGYFEALRRLVGPNEHDAGV